MLDRNDFSGKKRERNTALSVDPLPLSEAAERTGVVNVPSCQISAVTMATRLLLLSDKRCPFYSEQLFNRQCTHTPPSLVTMATHTPLDISNYFSDCLNCSLALIREARQLPPCQGGINSKITAVTIIN